MNRLTDGLKNSGKHMRRDVYGYVCACALLLVLLLAGKYFLWVIPVKALTAMLMYLFFGGIGIFVVLVWFLPSAEQSEYFRVFELLYHPGIWILAVSALIDGAETWSGAAAEYLHLACIAGWTLLAAGVIVLILIMKEKQI